MLDEELCIAAGRLIRIDKQSYDAFLGALQHRLNRLDEDMRNATPDTLQSCQGRAQEAAALLKLLREAHINCDKILAKGAKRP